MAALRSGSGGPPILGKFWLEEALWTTLGLRLDDLAKRPAREVEDYITIMRVRAHIAKERPRK